MIQIKSQREIELMREAGHILELTRQMLEKHVKPGISTLQLDELAYNFIQNLGATPSFKGYHGFPGSLCTSINEVVVHGIPSKKDVLKEGDIITLDFGVNYKGYHADSATTYAVGQISPEIKQLLEVTEKALYVGLEQAKPGNHVSDISFAIESFVKPYGYGIVEEFTGHGIGRELHEEPYVPNFGKPNQGPILKPGMTFCVEPMVNLGTKRVKVLSDNWTTVTTDRKPSAHFEHMIVITETGYDILTTLKKE
ncbi:MAG: type I methionyl aminopeptidase [Acholeplasmataceae bacterium]|nr:type I methionyl aminopeptidase [Acholeplasmataceae bacterium]MDD4193788.1 type I methionyl aminopeptidase [Acholeplasmataceae bacterium]MDY0339113.1 type I methionyl aminopeptidase [Acholeplasmataceae bacterium]